MFIYAIVFQNSSFCMYAYLQWQNKVLRGPIYFVSYFW